MSSATAAVSAGISTAPEGISELRYHELADSMLSSLQVSLEEYAEDTMSREDWDGGESIDVELSQGVLTLDLGDRRGVFVINKQAPNKQIWLSSPVTGPARFEFQDTLQQWVHVREPGACHTHLRRLETSGTTSCSNERIRTSNSELHAREKQKEAAGHTHTHTHTRCPSSLTDTRESL